MRRVGLKALKNHLREYVRLAASGQTVLVTDRGRVVAELVPPTAGRNPWVADAFLAEAVRDGYLTPPMVIAEGPPPHLRVDRHGQFLEELDRDRQDR